MSRQRIERRGAGRERGLSLIESLIAIFLFSVAVLGLLAAFANTKQVSGDAQYRIEASHFAQEALERIWSTVSRDSSGNVIAAGDAMSLDQFALAATYSCPSTFTTLSAASVLCAWRNRLTAPGSGVPGATAAIAIDTGATAYNRVTITLTWQAPGDAAAHRYEVVGHIN